jgi:DNA repair exonuclease SbcCD ATPase subunit
MGSTSEREYNEKLDDIRKKLSKRAKSVRDDTIKIEKVKVDALEKIEDMRRAADKEANKIEENIAKSKDLAPESKQRLSSELAIIRNEIEDNYAKLRRQIAESIVPVVA